MIGTVDHTGAIIGRADDGRNPVHGRADGSGHRWRWCVWSQEWCEIYVKAEHLTHDENRAVERWLVERGYADEGSFR